MKREAPSRSGARVDERQARLRRGASAELIAALLLMAKGYRIVARRHRTPFGEVDLIAARGRRLAFVEVKRRATVIEAQAALTPHQMARIGRAADHWLDHNPAYRDAEIGLDAILVVPRRWPVHLANALDRL